MKTRTHPSLHPQARPSTALLSSPNSRWPPWIFGSNSSFQSPNPPQGFLKGLNLSLTPEARTGQSTLVPLSSGGSTRGHSQTAQSCWINSRACRLSQGNLRFWGIKTVASSLRTFGCSSDSSSKVVKLSTIISPHYSSKKLTTADLMCLFFLVVCYSHGSLKWFDWWISLRELGQGHSTEPVPHSRCSGLKRSGSWESPDFWTIKLAQNLALHPRLHSCQLPRASCTNKPQNHSEQPSHKWNPLSLIYRGYHRKTLGFKGLRCPWHRGWLWGHRCRSGSLAWWRVERCAGEGLALVGSKSSLLMFMVQAVMSQSIH